MLLIPEDGEGPAFAYTLGLFHSFGHAEVLVMGLPLEAAHKVLNLIGNKVKAGRRYTFGQESAGLLEGQWLTFRIIKPENYDEMLGRAVRFYGGQGFPALQCFWPDASGGFPWQEGFDEEWSGQQWLLFEPLPA